MKPTQTLPETHSLAWQVNLKTDKRLNLLLQLSALFWAAIVAVFLWRAFQALRPDWNETHLTGNGWNILGLFLLVLVLSVILHELVHGAFFWWFTKHPPKFGMGLGYAYATMPGWFFSKRQYLAVGLAPLAGLTALGLLLVPFLPGWMLDLFFIGLFLNAAGAIGDIYICIRIAREAEDVWVKDFGHGTEVYRRG